MFWILANCLVGLMIAVVVAVTRAYGTNALNGYVFIWFAWLQLSDGLSLGPIAFRLIL